ncbi:NAD-dependent epimerase/dehydratase family protein [Thiomicrorhabdus hydrogeniphila]
MKLLLTGATGFIGKALVLSLLGYDYSIRALLRSPSLDLPHVVDQVICDLTELVDEVLEQSRHSKLVSALKGVDVLVHTAARAHIMQEEAANPLEEYRKMNRDATLVLARMAAESGVKRFVFLSSIKVNGEFTRPGNSFLPDDKYIPTDPYGLSKYEAEQGLLKIAKETDMEVVIIRPPLVYGPGVKANFSSMMNWVNKGVPLPFGAVHNKRSLVALDNLVDFISLCADREKSPKAANQVFLISDGEDVSTTQLLQKVAKAFNRKAMLLPIPVWLMTFMAKLLGKGVVVNRLFGSLQVDSSKARDLLGWKPVTTMDEQLKKTADLFKDNHEDTKSRSF